MLCQVALAEACQTRKAASPMLEVSSYWDHFVSQEPVTERASDT